MMNNVKWLKRHQTCRWTIKKKRHVKPLILQVLFNSIVYVFYHQVFSWRSWLLVAFCTVDRLCGYRPSKTPTSPPGRTSRGRRSSWRCSNTSTLCDSMASVLTESRWPWCSNTWDTETSTDFLGTYTGLARDGWSITSQPQYETHRCCCED